MAARSIGFRLGQEFKPVSDKLGYRVFPEIMVGFSSKFMSHLSLYASNIYQSSFQFEGASLYGKYRFLALDQVHSHFRTAVFGRASWSRNPNTFQEINLQGDNSGFSGGLVLTQLLHKLALSASLEFDHPLPYFDNQVTYSLSSGYLFLPFHYTSYKQTNLNFYIEVLGKSSLENHKGYLDIAPSFQFIFNSRTRLDFSYQKQISGNLSRFSREGFLIRLEYNIFNGF